MNKNQQARHFVIYLNNSQHARHLIIYCCSVAAFLVGYALLNINALNFIFLGAFYRHPDPTWAYSRVIQHFVAQFCILSISCGILLLAMAAAKLVVKLFIIFIVFVNLVSSIIYWWISGMASISGINTKFDSDIVLQLLSVRASATNAMSEYIGVVLGAATAVALMLSLLAVAAAIARAHQPPLRHPLLAWAAERAGAAALPLFLGWNLVLFGLGVLRNTELPNDTGLFLNLIGVMMTADPPPDSEAVALRPTASPIRHVILVVDESVRSDFYDAIIKPDVIAARGIDFGQTTSISPCSAGSNSMLRWGLNPRDPTARLRDPRRGPMLWGYGKAAGYSSSLFNGQTAIWSDSFVDGKEFSDIDRFIPLLHGVDTDRDLASAVNRQVREPGRTLTYVVKRGSHVPYENDYPPAALPMNASLVDRYRAAVGYPNQQFFSRLTEGLDMAETLIIYTSDHGQRLRRPGASHCDVAPDFEEFMVPLAAFTENEAWRNALTQAASRNMGTSSAFQIFPTLLIAMGYDKDDVERLYYPSLLADNVDNYILSTPYVPFPTRTTPELSINRISDMKLPRDGRY